jgi:hypothetical protein
VKSTEQMSDTDFGLQVRAMTAANAKAVDSSIPSLVDLTPAPAPVAAPVTPAALVVYSPEAMVQLMVDHPEYTHAQFAAAFGRKANWFAAVLANGEFQAVLEPRRSEIHDPSLTATMEERMRGLALQSLNVLQQKLDTKEVNEQTILKAMELSTKALGMGMAVPVTAPVLVVNGAEAVADRILQAMLKAKERSEQAVIDVQSRMVKAAALAPTPNSLDLEFPSVR